MLTITSCGQPVRQKPPAGTSTGVVKQTIGVIRARYTTIIRQDGQEFRQEYEVIADGDRRTRINYFGEPETDWEKRTDGSWTVWDGQVLLDYNPNDAPAYTRLDDRDAGQRPVYVLRQGSPHFRRACPQARRLGTHALLGRTAVRYACAASSDEGGMPEPHEMSLDQATGLLLKDDGATLSIAASEVDFDRTVDVGTFSTELPARAQDASDSRIDDFHLPRVGGGELTLAAYPPPLVIVVGDAAGIRKMVARLLPLTQGGVRPRVIGMLVAVPPPDWKGSLLNPTDAASFAEETSKAAGAFPVPVGVDIKGAASYLISQATGIEAGQTEPTAVAFVASDGTMAHASTDAATDDKLRELIDTLQ
ncbi:hypothetical protein [Micromonospora sp. SL4-19]|uniref:hypothetical protein n=1 Tax=Micromonospora sp. SL4-19 TaxID=3399129 RepID=UPI003A4DE1CB